MRKPFIKWAGGKTQLINELVKLIPESFSKYYEPFIGGGALFFHLSPRDYYISDINPELINLYNIVASHSSDLINLLKSYPYSEEFFYQLRKKKFEKLNTIDAAARTIYLNRTCFNGLYRVNKKGEFNVPFAKYKKPNIIQEEKIKSASEILNVNNIHSHDFRKLNSFSFSNTDLVFFDPPYVPIGKFSDFKRYNKEQFSLTDHEDLFKTFKKISETGAKVILTNSDTDFVRELYSDFSIKAINTKRNINSSGNNRKGVDLIIYNE